jgi:hypothetical protein
MRPRPAQRDQTRAARAGHLLQVIRSLLEIEFKASQVPSDSFFLSFFLFALVFVSLFPPFYLGVFILLSLSFFIRGPERLPSCQSALAQW